MLSDTFSVFPSALTNVWAVFCAARYSRSASAACSSGYRCSPLAMFPFFSYAFASFFFFFFTSTTFFFRWITCNAKANPK